MRSYDVVVVTDPRLSGGGNKSLALEVRAHAQRGYTTGILPLASSTRGARPVDHSIRSLLDDGLAEWVRPGDGVQCRLAIARGPSIFLEPQASRVRLTAERGLLVANAVHPDPSMSSMAYDARHVDIALAEMFGFRWEWSPLSEVVRHELQLMTSEIKISDETWLNIIDVDRWSTARPDVLRRPMRLGRHSRDHVQKWPETPEDILAAYPEAAEYDVRILGGAKVAYDILGRIPENWTVEGFDRRDPREFLSSIDIYAYFHHPKLVEAFGRAPLEAIASGAVAILPRYLEAVFGPASLYGEPADVRRIAERLASDPAFLAERRSIGSDILRERFSESAYLARLSRIMGGPGTGGGTTTRPATKRKAPVAAEMAGLAAAPSRPSVVFFTDNGHGLGHISRMMAIAKHCGDDVNPMILTMSEAFHLASEADIPAEYFPSIRRLGINRSAWLELLRVRIEQLVARIRPTLLVIDHVNPALAALEVAAETDFLETMWVRRGLWRHGHMPRGARHSDLFDHILEPTDIAAAFDQGATARLADSRVHFVRPISLVGPEDLIPRVEARQQLGLPKTGIAILVNLSADTPEALIQLISRVRDAVVKRRADVTLFAPLHILHSGDLPRIDGVVMRPVYPVARYLNAFDAAISTSGYNTFHEIVLAGVPCIYMARQTDGLDDQALRARSAELGGFGLHVEDVWSDTFERAVDRLVDPVLAGRMRRAAHLAHPGNGALDAARLVSAIACRQEVR